MNSMIGVQKANNEPVLDYAPDSNERTKLQETIEVLKAQTVEVPLKFGGGRASGTNDKAGSVYNLLRWGSVRTVKETLVPAKTISYPHENKK